MPPLSTHFRLASLVMPSLGIMSHIGSFLLGTTAPDAFASDSEASFSQHHFQGEDQQFSLHRFLQDVRFSLQLSDDPTSSFTCGYYSHLWLDVFYRNHAERPYIKKPIGMSDMEMKDLVRKETEILNAPFVLEFGNLPLPQRKDFQLPAGLEFVELERCLQLFREVVKQSQAWSQLAPTLESLDGVGYSTFLQGVAKLFMNEFRIAA